MIPQLQLWPSFPGSRIATRSGSDEMGKKADAAKDLRVQTGCLRTLNLATFNCRTLSTEARLLELQELGKIHWDVFGLSEVRRKHQGQLILRSGHILYYSWKKLGKMNGGIGFLVHKRLPNNIVEFESISDKVGKIVTSLKASDYLSICSHHMLHWWTGRGVLWGNLETTR